LITLLFLFAGMSYQRVRWQKKPRIYHYIYYVLLLYIRVFYSLW